MVPGTFVARGTPMPSLDLDDVADSDLDGVTGAHGWRHWGRRHGRWHSHRHSASHGDQRVMGRTLGSSFSPVGAGMWFGQMLASLAVNVAQPGPSLGPPQSSAYLPGGVSTGNQGTIV